MERTVDYIGFRGKYCDIVRLGSDWFDYRNDEEKLPNVGAFCKHCAKETAKPVYPIYMNGRQAYALKCTKCGIEYPMYKSMYIERYVGYNTPNGGHVSPTHGTMTHQQAMDRKARENHNNIPKKVEKQMCEAFGYTPDEYRQMKKKWNEESKKRHKRFEAERAELREQYKNEEIQRKSAERKELIEKGILKYVKNIGLVDTRTGNIVRL